MPKSVLVIVSEAASKFQSFLTVWAPLSCLELAVLLVCECFPKVSDDQRRMTPVMRGLNAMKSNFLRASHLVLSEFRLRNLVISKERKQGLAWMAVAVPKPVHSCRPRPP